MQNSPDEVLKQILIQSNESQIQGLCSTNKRFAQLCQDQQFMHAVYHQKVQNTIAPEIIALKPLNMSWKEFYTRIYNLKNHPLENIEYYKHGDLLEIQIMMNMNPPINPSVDEVNYAAHNGHLDVVKYLVSKGFRPTPTAVNYAAAYGHYEMVKYLVSLGINPTQDGINWATRHGRLEVVQYLVSLGMRPNEFSVHIAAKNSYTDLVNYLASLNPPILPYN